MLSQSLTRKPVEKHGQMLKPPFGSKFETLQVCEFSPNQTVHSCLETALMVNMPPLAFSGVVQKDQGDNKYQ